MRKFEYFILLAGIKVPDVDVNLRLSEVGRQGWELINVVAVQGEDRGISVSRGVGTIALRYYFKRELIEKED